MRVTRITIDADLGLIDLKTGPGGDGDYVLLPLEISEGIQRYVTFAGEKCEAEAPTIESPNEEFVDRISGGTLTLPGGWSIPEGQITGSFTTDEPWRTAPYGAELDNFPPVPRGGIKYPDPAMHVGATYERSPELQKEFDKYLAADVADECDGNCGAHPVKKGKADDVWTRAPGEGAPTKERHTGPATITNPIRVFADEHSRGYRLHSPALPGWRADINQYDLYKVPEMIRSALVDMGSEHAINYPVTITVMEEEM